MIGVARAEMVDWPLSEVAVLLQRPAVDDAGADYTPTVGEGAHR